MLGRLINDGPAIAFFLVCVVLLGAIALGAPPVDTFTLGWLVVRLIQAVCWLGCALISWIIYGVIRGTW